MKAKPFGYWTYERCKEEALKYTLREDFHKGSGGAYMKAYVNKWLDEICSHMTKKKRPSKWNFETCKQEALKYSNRITFKKKASKAYEKARLNGWLDEVCKHMNTKVCYPKGYWDNFEKCKKEALKYKTGRDFCIGSSGAYNSALKNNWMEEVCKHMKRKHTPSERYIYVFIFDDKYFYVGLSKTPEKRYKAHLSNKPRNKSAVKKFLNTNPDIKFTFEILDKYDENTASIKEGEIKTLYEQKGLISINRSKTGGLGGNNEKYNNGRIKQEALKYKSRSEFQRKAKNFYDTAIRRKILNDVCGHMKPLCTPKNYWTYERCKAEASKYGSKSDFRKNKLSVYQKCQKKKWLNDFFPENLNNNYPNTQNVSN